MKILKRFIQLTIISYALILTGAYFFQEHLLFFPNKENEPTHISTLHYAKELFLDTNDHEKINALLFENKSYPTLTIYFHGNTGSIAHWKILSESFLNNFSTNLLLIDYRGFGKSSGKFSESGFYLDAQAAYSYARSIGYSDNQIVVYGRSLGTGIAVDLASKVPARALILETPYTSVLNRSKELYPYLLPTLTLRYPFDSEHKINLVKMPIFIFHGTDDKVIPFQHGKELYSKIPGNKTFIQLVGGQHSGLEKYKEYQETLKNFYQSLNSTITLL